ncbi:GNAT family N-acetyltransferase [Pedobacter sp. BS3]|uniref:GNAT family N-acetyltransferase n=1 Tax=Pedobacter sp. BS3 TaxID=2567937 RepID=UPI001F5B379A|nr:GNAT family N-acetyltransferase [Pedobacter sp. BS3]
MLKKVFDIRRTVFIEEQHCPPEMEWEYDEESTHFLAFVNGNAAGTARWRKTEQGIKLERFAVLKDYRGIGVGSALVENVLADIRPAPGDQVCLHAQIMAIPLYERFGFVKENNPFEEAGILHYKMVLHR